MMMQTLLFNVHSNNCIFIIMAIYLEAYLEREPTSKYLFSGGKGDNAPMHLKTAFNKSLRNVVWSQDEYMETYLTRVDEITDAEGGIGTHAIRKFPAQYVQKIGCDPAVRGGWKGRKVGQSMLCYEHQRQSFQFQEDAKVQP